jgi:hypothetical protein
VVSTTYWPLYPRERAGTHCTGGWVGPRAGLDVCEKSRPHRDSIPGLSSPYSVAIPTELSWPLRHMDSMESFGECVHLVTLSRFHLQTLCKCLEVTDADDVQSAVSLQVVNVVGPDHIVEHTESEKESPFTGERWFEMETTIHGTMPDG